MADRAKRASTFLSLRRGAAALSLVGLVFHASCSVETSRIHEDSVRVEVPDGQRGVATVEGPPTASPMSSDESTAPSASQQTTEQADNDPKECLARINKTLAEPAAPGAPAFEAQRLQILTRVKAEPLLLVDVPTVVEAEPPRLVVQGYRTLLARTKHPWDALARMLPHFNRFPRQGRQTILKDGYLYADNQKMASALVNKLRAKHLFGHDNIWLQRGSMTYHAARKRGRYVFTDGPNEGEQVRLLLLDRIGHGEPPAKSLGRDFRTLRAELNFSEAKVRHLGWKRIVADLKYGPYSVPTLLEAEGARLTVVCESVAAGEAAGLTRERAQRLRRAKVVGRLQVAILESILDQLPFDEPRNEYGFQLDGILRKNWRAAYFSGRRSFAYNGDRYRVFGSRGRPLVPQVCVDFLTDTLERASGTWWQNGKEPRKRVVGKLNFDELDRVERGKLRRVPGFLRYAEAFPERFVVSTIAKEERVPMGERELFLDFIRTRRERYAPGDIVVIRGYTPWDPHQRHYHSFFIYESDPLTGVPIAIAGNAGRPSVRNWETEARRTPKRSVWNRVYIKTEWLESIMDGTRLKPFPAPPMSPPGNAG